MGGWADERMSGRAEVSRREAIAYLAAVPLTLSIDWDTALEAHARVLAAGSQFQARFFTRHEWDTVRVLVDIIIPRDERSGGATDAGVPEFMDFILNEQTNNQTRMRGGLAWLDTECHERFGKTFLASTEVDRTAVLDDIAWPAKAKPQHSQGVAFFTWFRDLTASGYYSSKVGMEDLRYMGNTMLAEWKGCSEEQLRKLGVRYTD
jgi:gluconate 2-dehydrogenase gamma chain